MVNRFRSAYLAVARFRAPRFSSLIRFAWSWIAQGLRFGQRSAPSRSDLDPVLAVRVGQFKTDVARVVVDLSGQTPYTLRAEGNMVVVTFDSIHRNPASLESKGKSTDPTASPVKGPGEQVASPPLPTVPNKLPVAKVEDLISPSPARAEPLPTRQSLSAPAQIKPAPVRVKEDVGVAATVADTAPLAQKFKSIPTDQDYVIGVQDLLAIDVWREPEVSRTVPVRPDGKISLPLVGELSVSGLTPREVEKQLSAELEAYVRKPQVTVVVQEVNSRKFYVIGQVERPGTYPLSAHMTVLEALATVGGFRDFAKVQQIYLLRLLPDGSRRRIYFNYKAAVNGKDPYNDTELEIGDTIVVP